MIVKEVLVSLGFDYDSADKKEISDFEKSLDETAKKMFKLAGAITAAGAAAIIFIARIADTTDELGKLADQIDENVESIDSWRFAADQMIGKSEGVAQSIATFAKNIGLASRGLGSAVEPLGRLGVVIRDQNGQLKGTSELLLDVADGFRRLGLDDREQLGVAEQLGIGNLAQILRRSRPEIEALLERAREIGVVTEEQARVSAQFNDNLGELKRSFGALGREILTLVGPALSDIMEGIVDWWLDNKDEVISWMKSLISLMGGVTNILKTMVLLTTALLAAGLIGKLPMIIKWVAALNPALIIIAGLLVAIGLAVEEIMAFFDDDKQGLFEKWAEDSKLFNDIFSTISETAEAIFAIFGEIDTLLSSPGDAQAWQRFFDQILNIAIRFIVGITNSTIRGVNLLIAGANKVAGALGIADIPTIGLLDADQAVGGADYLRNLAANAYNGGANSGSLAGAGAAAARSAAGSGVSLVANNNVTINGSGLSEQEVQRATHNALRQGMRGAVQDLQKGINR